MTGRARLGSGDPWQAEINRTFGLRFNITGDAPDRREAVANRVDWHRRTRTAHLAKLVFAAHRTAQLGGKARGSSDPVLVSHLTDGTCRVEQAGHKDRATAGDLYLIDTGQPFLIETTRMATRAILIDRHTMRSHFPHFERYGACVLRGRDHSGKVASNIANDLFEAAQDGSDWVDRLVDCLCQFLGYAIPRDHPPEAADVRLCAAMAFARDRLGDTDLRAGDLAAAAGVSIRHLNALFAATGQTPMRWLMDERLAAAARELSDPQGIPRRVSDIAEAHGFRDSAHLSTAFRRRFGVSPRAYRSRTGGETPTQRTQGQADSRNSQDFQNDDP